uniref:Polynucleotidyl transferase, Ribonuclease H fold n=1 Tax=Medicago truncatula TaxID=3880 RepID=A2Q5B0_MEDTR|nr:Polynucleotidyl transferase, Ribonuclease H fold [Medicago truncatula]
MEKYGVFTMNILPGRIDHGMISQRWYDILVAWPTHTFFLAPPLDGASSGGVQAGCGSLFQDEHEIWSCGFFKYFGRCNTYVAELWGAYEGLEIALDRGYFRVEYNVNFNIIPR